MRRISVPLLLTLSLLTAACGSEAPPAATPAAGEGSETCSGVDAFEAALRDVGIAYDYEPSDSAEELAKWSDAIVAGTLREVVEAPAEMVGRDMAEAVFTIEVDRVIAQWKGPDIGGTLELGIEFNPNARSIEDYREVLPIGAKTVVFLTQYGDGWSPHLEGFWFACGGDDPPGVGIVEPGWSAESLTALIAAVEAGPEIKPEPAATTSEFNSENVEGDRIRVWPRSADVAAEGTYRFTVPHCGLDWMVDFDASFWSDEKPEDYGKGNRYPFFYNSDAGTFTFESEDAAVYEVSTGEMIPLQRLDGPIDILPCM